MSALVGTRWGWTAVWACVVGGCFPPALPREVDGEEVDTAEVDGAEVDESLEPPAEVVASTERAGDVELTWRAVSGATAYRILRCAEPCDEGAETLTEVSATRHVDTTVAAPGLPGAPTPVASRDQTEQVHVSWDAVSAPASPRYRYRVVALGGGEESAPSEPAVGYRAERPVIGYEVQVDDGSWRAVSGLTWDDVAAAATLVPGTVAASRGTYAGFVRVTVSGAAATAGTARDYKVRAMTDFGPGPVSAVARGYRVAGPLTYRWERSLAASDDDYAVLAGATTASHDDTSAPEDGGARYYRVVVSAEGAESVVSDGVPGSRQGPPGVPSGLAATSNLTGFVRLTWQPAEGAHRYHVYRDGAKLTSGGGITATTYDDALAGGINAWAGPTGLTASQDRSEHVALTWVAPERPLGTLHTYHVTAVNDAAESVASPTAAGRRAAPALVGFEVDATVDGVTTTREVGLVTSFWDTSAPRAEIAVEHMSLLLSGGDFRAHVKLHLAGPGATIEAAVAVTYAVRGILSDEARTPSSGSSIGRRANGPVQQTWERSAGVEYGDWQAFSCGATGCLDTEASELGEKRWYRVVFSAEGAESREIGGGQGWRLAFESVSGSCAVSTDGNVWCWGSTEDPASPEPINAARLPTLGNIVQVVGNRFDGCARTRAGLLHCWGLEDRLGVEVPPHDPDAGPRPPIPMDTPVHVDSLVGVTSVARGGSTCVTLSSGEARCWGDGWSLPLGNNDPNGAAQFVPVAVRTSDSGIVSGVASFPGGYVGTMNAHQCVRMNDSTVRCWGNNGAGQLGDPSFQAHTANWAIQVQGLIQVAALATGGNHSCAMVTGGTVKCWGQGASGQLGQGDHWNEGYSYSPLTVRNLQDAVEVSAGETSSCARRVTGAVVCWGRNGHGELGNGLEGPEHDYAMSPAQVATLTAVTALGSGSQHHCAIQAGQVYCWGRNWRGALGDGTLVDRRIPTPIVVP